MYSQNSCDSRCNIFKRTFEECNKDVDFGSFKYECHSLIFPNGKTIELNKPSARVRFSKSGDLLVVIDCLKNMSKDSVDVSLFANDGSRIHTYSLAYKDEYILFESGEVLTWINNWSYRKSRQEWLGATISLFGKSGDLNCETSKASFVKSGVVNEERNAVTFLYEDPCIHNWGCTYEEDRNIVSKFNLSTCEPVFEHTIAGSKFRHLEIKKIDGEIFLFSYPTYNRNTLWDTNFNGICDQEEDLDNSGRCDGHDSILTGDKKNHAVSYSITRDEIIKQ